MPRRHLLRTAGTMLAAGVASTVGVAGGLGAAVWPPGESIRPAVARASLVTPAAPAAPPSAILPTDSYVERYHQRWALSCEYAATHTALRLVGHHVGEEVMRPMLGQGEDPDETFRGEIQANQTLDNYGVHARGIVRLVELLKQNALIPNNFQAPLLYDMDSMRAALASGHPVIAWVPLTLRGSSRVPTRLSNGKLVNLVYAEHCVTVYGYNGDQWYILEPYNGSVSVYDSAAFARGMSLFDDPALAITLPAPAPASAPAPLPSSEYFADTGVTLDGGFYRAYREWGGREGLGVPVTTELDETDAVSGALRQVIYTVTSRLEWYPESQSYGLGFVGDEYLGETAAPDPDRRLGGALARQVAATGGLRRYGYSISEEVPFDSDSELLPFPMTDVVGQWFQTGLLLWSRATGVVPGRAGLALARQRRFTG